MNIENLISKINASVPAPENTYMGDDGLKHCGVCHEPVQTVKHHPFTGEKLVLGVICECRKKELAKHKQAEENYQKFKARQECFHETNMMDWTFANDDRQNPKMSDAMQKYVNNFTEFRKEGRGLLLSGHVGTGKTYLAACIANALIDKGYRVKMAKFTDLVNTIQGMFDGKQQFINSLNNYQLLILDDLGAERKSEFMQEMVFNIIDSRYRAGLPLIITTNLSLDEIKKPQDIGYSRIYDRILERCFPVVVEGGSRRRQKVKDSYFDIKNKLGL